ncbi:MAG: RND transporter [Gammaproteobacteria bacterium]
MKILDRLPLWGIALLALAMGTAPLGSQPHLMQKILMLAAGNLTTPIDIFDLFLHGIFPLLLVVKLLRMWLLRLSAHNN